jgi:hypothetical protein
MGADNGEGFRWRPQNRTGSPQALHFFLDIKGGTQVNFYLDQLCELLERL